MKQAFQKHVEKSRRNLVIHNIVDEKKTLSSIKQTDIVFFDDCTFDQYRFVTENIQKIQKNTIVFGFSTNLYRSDDDFPITGMTTGQLHDGFHGGNEDMRRGFVSLKELKELESHENVYIALHGHNHLYLETMPIFERSVIFRKELEKSIGFLHKIGMRTNIFVYPYDFTDCLSDKILHENGFHHIYPSEKRSRIYVEDILR